MIWQFVTLVIITIGILFYTPFSFSVQIGALWLCPVPIAGL